VSEDIAANWLAEINDIAQRLPPNATISRQYRTCGKRQCKKCSKGKKHGPYFYGYWKEDKRQRSIYIDKSLRDFTNRIIAQALDVRPRQLDKLEYIQKEASRGNVLAKQCLDKLRNRKVSIDYAYKEVNHQRKLREQTLNVIRGMQKQGLDPNNEEDVLGYLRAQRHPVTE
jgi:hypothetical protein